MPAKRSCGRNFVDCVDRDASTTQGDAFTCVLITADRSQTAGTAVLSVSACRARLCESVHTVYRHLWRCCRRRVCTAAAAKASDLAARASKSPSPSKEPLSVVRPIKPPRPYQRRAPFRTRTDRQPVTFSLGRTKFPDGRARVVRLGLVGLSAAFRLRRGNMCQRQQPPLSKNGVAAGLFRAPCNLAIAWRTVEAAAMHHVVRNCSSGRRLESASECRFSRRSVLARLTDRVQLRHSDPGDRLIRCEKEEDQRAYVRATARVAFLRPVPGSSTAGHPGAGMTLRGSQSDDTWQGTEKIPPACALACAGCQKNRPQCASPPGLRQRRRISTRPWRSSSLDSLTSLPPSRVFAYDAICCSW